MKKIILIAFIFLICAAIRSFSQCAPVFYDGFESGTYSPTWSAGSDITGTVTTTNPASGLYRLEGSGGNSSHLNGFYTFFLASTPSQISWWIYPSGLASTNYFVAGNSSVSAINCIVFCYYQGGSGNIRFVGSPNYDYSATANQWYHIELLNINWSAHTFDIYINGILAYTSFPFRSSTQNNISRVHLYNYNSGMGVWDEIQIGNNNPLTLSQTSIEPLCNGYATGSIDLTATSTNPGTITYNWSNGTTSQDATSLSAGTYSVWVTDPMGCEDSIMNIVITEPTAITSNITGSILNCNGDNDGTASIAVSGGTPDYSYLWSNGETDSNASGLSGAEYFCTVTDSNGCTHADSVTIIEPTAITTSINSFNISCNGANDGSASINASGGTPGYTYWWSNSETTTSISDLSGGTFYCIVTDVSGCLHQDSVEIIDPNPISILLIGTNPTTCGGINGGIDATVSGGTGTYNYLWNDGTTTEDVSYLGQGNYYVIVSDVNGCTSSSTTTLTDPEPANITLNIPQDTVCLTISSFNLTGASLPGGTYSGTGVSAGSFSPTMAGTGDHVITYNVNDTNNCATSAQDVITVKACLGFEENNNADLIHIYPNPTSSYVHINICNIENNFTLNITNDLGSSVETIFITHKNAVLNLENYVPGIYFLNFTNTISSFTKKIVVQ